MAWITVTQMDGKLLIVNMSYAIAIGEGPNGTGIIQWADPNGTMGGRLEVSENALTIKDRMTAAIRGARQSSSPEELVGLSPV